jgi:DivIVA domain-containing protein
VQQVDVLLRRLDEANPAGPERAGLIEDATFRSSKKGYSPDHVDWFLQELLMRERSWRAAGADPWDEFEAADRYRPLEAADIGSPDEASSRLKQQARKRMMSEWSELDEEQGLHLRYQGKSRRPSVLLTADNEPLVTVKGRYALTEKRRTVHLVTKKGSYTLRSVCPRRWLAPRKRREVKRSPESPIAVVAAEARCDRGGHHLSKDVSAQSCHLLGLQEATDDATGVGVLYISGQTLSRRCWMRITFPDGRWLRFLVRGDLSTSGIMTASDQSGRRLVRYKVARPLSTEIKLVVNPSIALSEELLLAMSLSAPSLPWYFVDRAR